MLTNKNLVMSLIRYQPTEMTTWTPFERLATLRDEMNRIFDNSWPSRDTGLFSGWSPPVDVFEDKDGFSVLCELPGMKKEEIDLSVHNGTLTIAGERKHEHAGKEGESFRSERYFGRFQRSVSLPTAVDSSKVKAIYRDGVLEVELPKSEEAKQKQIEVNIG